MEKVSEGSDDNGSDDGECSHSKYRRDADTKSSGKNSCDGTDEGKRKVQEGMRGAYKVQQMSSGR